jgi:hypothetical protein
VTGRSESEPTRSLVIRTSGGRPSRRMGKAGRSREAAGASTAMPPSGRQGRHVTKVQEVKSGRPGRTAERVAPAADVYKAENRSGVGVRSGVGGADSTRAGEDNITSSTVKLISGCMAAKRWEVFARGSSPAFIDALEAASEL